MRMERPSNGPGDALLAEHIFMQQEGEVVVIADMHSAPACNGHSWPVILTLRMRARRVLGWGLCPQLCVCWSWAGAVGIGQQQWASGDSSNSHSAGDGWGKRRYAGKEGSGRRGNGWGSSCGQQAWLLLVLHL